MKFPSVMIVMMAGMPSARLVQQNRDKDFITHEYVAKNFLKDKAETKSGCHYYLANSCCTNPVCKCPDGKTYEMNGRNYYRHHIHGCDPPGAIMENPAPDQPEGTCCNMKDYRNKWWDFE